MSGIDGFSHRETEKLVMQAESIPPSVSILVQKSLLATKFFVPVASRPLISRHRLTDLLDESFKYPLTLVSAPAGFGKTTLVASWAQSLSVQDLRLSWVALDEEHNEPRLFWTYMLAALNRHPPERFTALLMQLYSSQAPPIKYILKALINLLAESPERFVLILDDYHLISEQQVHINLSYMVKHLPPQLRIILITREDPPLPLPHLQSHQQVLEIRTNQLRCTAEETKHFFQEVMGIQFPDETIQAVTARTEGWLVGLQLLSLSLPEDANPLTLLEEASGDQRYILDYLTEEVLRRQPQEVQTFLLSTCILEQLTASLCDAVMEQTGSQRMLERLERANLFVVSLDSKREWYRYHVLFAQALRCQLEQTHVDLVPILHHRASIWYAQHDQTTQAILHAFSARQWQWAADLIEKKSSAMNALTWGLTKRKSLLFQDWLLQIPMEIFSSRPRLCLAAVWILQSIAPRTMLEAWLNAAETTLTARLANEPMLVPQVQQEMKNMLGEVFTYRALVQSLSEEGEAAFPLCQRAQALLSADNVGFHAHLAVAQLFAYYSSSVNDAAVAVQIGLEAVSLNQAAGNTGQALSLIGVTAMHMIGTGRLHEIERLVQQAMLLGSESGADVMPGVAQPMFWRAEILREWNQLDAALACVEEAIKLCEQIESPLSLPYTHTGYVVLLRICLSRGDYERAISTLQEFERIGQSVNQPWCRYLLHHSMFTAIDQVKLWIACGEVEHAMGWAKRLDRGERHGTLLVQEREEVAYARVLLAKDQPVLALQRLEPVRQRATTGQRWGHVIEIRILQALAQQMLHEERLARDALSEAICLAEPQGYIRSFVDEGAPMASLLSGLREEQCKVGPTPYLDTLLAAFPQPSKVQARQAKRAGHQRQTQPLLDPLSEREREVLQLLARGASNQEIAQQLAIAVDTVKRHVSHIFAKLGVQNRVRAVKQAQELGLLGEED